MGLRAAVAWAPALACAVWAVARVFGLERGFPFIPVAAFAPYAAAGAVLVTLLALALRARLAALVAAAAAIALATTVVPRVIAHPSPDRGAQPGPRLRVLTLNTRYGRVPAADLVALVRRERPDVLSLQELTPRLDRALRRRGLRRLLPARAASPQPGAAGTGLYSRHPLGIVGTEFTPAAGTLRIPGALPVEVEAVHPGAPKDRSGVSDWVRELRALPPATPRGAVRVLAGDFNATLDHAELRRLMATGYDDAAAEAGRGLHATWPARGSLPVGIAIDHVLADARCGVGEVDVIAMPGTDHRAVLAELILPRAGPAGDRRASGGAVQSRDAHPRRPGVT